MSETMRALRAHKRGGAEVLAVENAQVPPIAPDEVLVAVHAAAITFDELGWDETWAHVPTVPAHEFSGVVVGRGATVADLELGDPVYGLIPFDRQGAAAEYLAIPAQIAARKPTLLSHAEAAAMPLAALTAWQGLFDRAKIQSGEQVLVHGGAGGVGAFALQLAKNAGAIVTVTARGEGVAFCRELGADVVIDTGTEDFASAGRVFDVVFDTIGGDVLGRSYDKLVPHGRLVTLQDPPDEERAEQAKVQALFFIVSPDVGELDTLANLADRGLLKVAIAARYPLEQGREAFESGSLQPRAPGKTVLIVRE